MSIVRARTLSRATMRNIHQNLFLSFAMTLSSVSVTSASRVAPWPRTKLSA